MVFLNSDIKDFIKIYEESKAKLHDRVRQDEYIIYGVRE